MPPGTRHAFAACMASTVASARTGSWPENVSFTTASYAPAGAASTYARPSAHTRFRRSPRKQLELAHEKQATRGVDNRLVDLNDIHGQVGALRECVLGPRIPAAAQREHPAHAVPALLAHGVLGIEQHIESVLVGKHRLEAPLVQIRRRLVDAALPQHARERPIRQPARAHERGTLRGEGDMGGRCAGR